MPFDFDKPYDPKQVEPEIYEKWEKSGYFNPDNLPLRHGSGQAGKQKTFTIALPPPNVTGSLHMGHALNAAIQDILIRKKRMEGYKALWIPGTDHAGIATQNVVEKELKKEGKTRHDLGREEFLKRVWAWKEKYGGIILDQLKKLGSSADWSRTRFTMDAQYAKAVEAAFLHYQKKGWIYQGERTINWCPRCATSLSDLEIQYKEEDAEWYEIKYGPLVIGTVRPETKLGDTAVAVNPKDKRYKKYIGQELEIDTVLGPATVRVIADPEVDMNFGTGAMKVTPAHDLHDFELAEKHHLEKKQVIGPDGRMTELAGKYRGLKTKEAREQIAKDLEAKGLLVSRKPYRHKVAVCYRCGATLEPILSKQWFLKMDELAKLAIQDIKKGKVKFHPKRWEKIYFDWLKNIKDWCISRQIWWGHRLPMEFSKKMGWHESIVPQIFKGKRNTYRLRDHKFEIGDQVAFENSQTGEIFGYGIITDIKRMQVSKANLKDKTHFATYENVDELIAALKRQNPNLEVTKDTQMFIYSYDFLQPDVLDTWFSSALWPFATLGWPEKTRDLEIYYPTQVLSTARDIINLWVARMIFSSEELLGKPPFSDIIIHATIMAKSGQRMSKSLGTGVDPMDLVGKYGADATRFGLVWQAMGTQDIKWAEEHVVAGRKFLNKIWNASRFVLGQLEKPKPKIKNAEDKKILAELKKAKKEANQRIEKYEFGQALHALHDFFWHKFCDRYLEESKKNLNPEVLLYVLADSLKLLHPFLPFITEKIWEAMPIKDPASGGAGKKLLMIETWPR